MIDYLNGLLCHPTTLVRLLVRAQHILYIYKCVLSTLVHLLVRTRYKVTTFRLLSTPAVVSAQLSAGDRCFVLSLTFVTRVRARQMWLAVDIWTTSVAVIRTMACSVTMPVTCLLFRYFCCEFVVIATVLSPVNTW